jgi:hypothetical protein
MFHYVTVLLEKPVLAEHHALQGVTRGHRKWRAHRRTCAYLKATRRRTARSITEGLITHTLAPPF